MNCNHYSLAAFIADRVRTEERALRDEVVSLIEAHDVEALARRDRYPIAVNILQSRMPTTLPLAGVLFEGGGALPLRLAQRLEIIRANAESPSIRKTARLIREATGVNGEICRALLTGTGHADAVLFRQIVEIRRGKALPVFDLSDDGLPDFSAEEIKRRAYGAVAASTRARNEDDWDEEGDDDDDNADQWGES